jgi:hypothetical protein
MAWSFPGLEIETWGTQLLGLVRCGLPANERHSIFIVDSSSAAASGCLLEVWFIYFATRPAA